MIYDRIYDNIPPQMKILNMIIPILMYFFKFYTSKTLYFVQNVSFVRDVNYYVDQSLHVSDVAVDVGFPTVYRRMYCRKFLTLSYQTSRYIHKCIRIPIDYM